MDKAKRKELVERLGQEAYAAIAKMVEVADKETVVQDCISVTLTALVGFMRTHALIEHRLKHDQCLHSIAARVIHRVQEFAETHDCQARARPHGMRASLMPYLEAQVANAQPPADEAKPLSMMGDEDMAPLPKSTRDRLMKEGDADDSALAAFNPPPGTKPH